MPLRKGIGFCQQSEETACAVSYNSLPITFAMAFPSAATSVIVTFSSRGSSFLFLATFTPI